MKAVRVVSVRWPSWCPAAGEGRVFTKDIPTSKEFAILVATLPFAEQQEIAAKLREMTEGRS